MGYFSEVLYIMDQNTTKYMIDSLHQKVEDQSHTIEDQSRTIKNQSHTIEDQASKLDRVYAFLAKKGIDPSEIDGLKN